MPKISKRHIICAPRYTHKQTCTLAKKQKVLRRIMLLRAFSLLYQYLLLPVLIKSTLGDSGIARILPQGCVRKHDQAVSR